MREEGGQKRERKFVQIKILAPYSFSPALTQKLVELWIVCSTEKPL